MSFVCYSGAVGKLKSGLPFVMSTDDLLHVILCLYVPFTSWHSTLINVLALFAKLIMVMGRKTTKRMIALSPLLLLTTVVLCPGYMGNKIILK